jgi:shikimate dehydrogenase
MTTKQVFTFDDLQHWEDVAPTLHPPAKLAVIGDPIAHSRSPQMHNPALEARGIDAQYIRVHVPVGCVEQALELFTKHQFLGVNCTIPHKFEALEAVDFEDDLACKLGAVNTVAIRDGTLFGYNSDGPGFLRSIKEAFGRDVSGLRVLIIGAGGGAGRAIAIQCALAGCSELILVNRTMDKIVSLKKAIHKIAPAMATTLFPWTVDALAEAAINADLIVNASPLGMKLEDPPILDPSLIRSTHLIYDMVYGTSGQTPLITAAQAVGAKTCDGLLLLLHQGAISFGHWFGEPVPLDVMRRGLLEG